MKNASEKVEGDVRAYNETQRTTDDGVRRSRYHAKRRSIFSSTLCRHRNHEHNKLSDPATKQNKLLADLARAS